MATKQKNIFTRSKPLINIYSGLDEEGKKVSSASFDLFYVLIVLIHC